MTSMTQGRQAPSGRNGGRKPAALGSAQGPGHPQPTQFENQQQKTSVVGGSEMA